MLSFLQRRLPRQDEILQVLGICAFFIFSWSLRGFFYNLPSFLLAQKPGTIFGTFSYMMAFALFETLLLGGALLLLSILLPSQWYREGFAYKGLLTILVLSVTSIRTQNFLTAEWPSKEVLLAKFALALVILVLLIRFAHVVIPIQKFLLEVTARMQIFFHIYIPIGALACLVITLRNIW